MVVHSFHFCTFRYCQKLPCDMYTILSPTFTFVKRKKDGACCPDDDSDDDEEDCDPKHEYQCQLTLPMNCPVKETVQVGSADKEHYSHQLATYMDSIVVEDVHLDSVYFLI